MIPHEAPGTAFQPACKKQSMFAKLEEIRNTFHQLSQQLTEPETIADRAKYLQCAKAHKELSEVVERYQEYLVIRDKQLETRGLAESEEDPEMKALALEELVDLEKREQVCKDQLRDLLTPKDPDDSKNVLLEIRAGTGGDEASLFAQEVFRMYSRYSERRNWKMQITNLHESEIGGLKEVVAMVEGERVYSRMKYESGVHRVQRVPKTEASGRVHTSAITVAVLPEADEVDVSIDPKDIRIDTFCSSGPGGQSVNTTYSAVRITHIPSGMVVSCQDEKSQIKNRAKAMRVLRSRLLEKAKNEQLASISENRRQMVGSGDRSEKIRTYNFPQNRVTDHRIGLTLYQLDEVMDGSIDAFVDALTTHYQAEKLKQAQIS